MLHTTVTTVGGLLGSCLREMSSVCGPTSSGRICRPGERHGGFPQQQSVCHHRQRPLQGLSPMFHPSLLVDVLQNWGHIIPI
jgi:hypothetical protein